METLLTLDEIKQLVPNDGEEHIVKVAMVPPVGLVWVDGELIACGKCDDDDYLAVEIRGESGDDDYLTLAS